MKTYHVESLEELAKLFDYRARTEAISAGRAIGVAKKQAEARCNTWNMAADILRDTELKVTPTGK